MIWAILADSLTKVIKWLTGVARAARTAGFASGHTLKTVSIATIVGSCALTTSVGTAALAAIPTGKADVASQVVGGVAVQAGPLITIVAVGGTSLYQADEVQKQKSSD